MAAMVLGLCARRVLSRNHRQLLNLDNTLRYSAGLPIEDRKSFSQNVPSWMISVFESPPVIFAERTITKFHEISGLPWWASIAISTMTLRVFLTLPLGIVSESNLARLANLEPEAKEMNRELKDEVARAKYQFDLTEKQATQLYKRSLKKQTTLLIERENCHPWKSAVLLLMQLPVWISISFALRDMAIAGAAGSFDYSSMITEGFLWCQNLTKADSTLILPVASAVLNLTNIELFHLKRNLPKTKILKIIHQVSRFGCFIVIPVGLVLPSATALYWVCSAYAALGQNLLLMSPRFRRLVRIPITAREDPKPYTTVWINFQTRILRRTIPVPEK